MKSRVKFDRRQMIRNSVLGVLSGTALTAVTRGQVPERTVEEKAGELFLAGGCPQLLKVSKRLQGPMNLIPRQPCGCECAIGDIRQTVFQCHYRAVLRFATVKPCDETELEPLLQGGVELWLEGDLTLRLDKCLESGAPVLIGRNQGRYHIHRYRPNEGIMDGSFCGTEGVLSTENGAKRCCAPSHGVGSFCGDGVNSLKSWSLCVSYHSLTQNLNPDQLCDRTTVEVTMDLDGVLIGPCQPV